MKHEDAATDDLIFGAEHSLCPEVRAKDGAGGRPVVLGDGATWLLADGGLFGILDELRDRMYDDSTLKDTVSVPDVQRAAMIMLLANYELDEDEAASLVVRAEHQPLADAVLASLFGQSGGGMTYTMWARSAMLANGIDPESIPAGLHSLVLNHLVWSGRAIPAGKLIDSAIAAPRLAAIRARIQRQSERAPEQTGPLPAPAVPAEGAGSGVS
jgi:hypothetical protein